MGYRNIKKQKKLIFLFKLRILIFNVPGQRILPILQECPWCCFEIGAGLSCVQCHTLQCEDWMLHTHSLVAYTHSCFCFSGSRLYAGFCNSDCALRPHVEIQNHGLKMYQWILWILNQSITDMSYQCHSEYKMLFGERGNMDIRLFSGQFVDITINPLHINMSIPALALLKNKISSYPI